MSNSNYEKMELFADIMEPVTMIFADPEVIGVITRNEPPIRAVKCAIKNHKDEVIEVLARLDGVEVKDYQFDGLKVMFKMLSFINRPEVLQTLKELFSSPQSAAAASSGDAMECTADDAN